MTALVLALALVFAVAVASAATITINRDSTWNEDGNGTALNTTFTWYKIFDAEITTAGTVNEGTGETTTAGVAVYTISGTNAADKVAALPSIFEANLASDGKYYITLANSSTTSTAIATALGTMLADTATAALFYEDTLTTDDTPVEITTASNGYYYIKASNGKDVVVQTIGSVTINEKNDYPTIDKKQKKASGSYADAALPQEIGSYIDYQVTVHVPADATKQIAVIDTMTAGLEYDSQTGLTVQVGSTPVSYQALTSTDAGYLASGAAWQIKFLPETVVDHRGDDIVITYRAKVTSAAITDSGKENEVTLNYDNGNYILHDDTDYETYFGGIYKVDPNDGDANMAGVKFDLTSGSADVNVTYDSTNGYYYVDPSSTSNEVETRAETVTTDAGTVTYYTIKIRGLDNDKTYTLTETVTKAGYNLLEGTVNLTKTKDEGQAFSNKALNTFDRVVNNKGTTLPSTGGIGTTIFYVLGGLLVVGAAVILVARRKASN